MSDTKVITRDITVRDFPLQLWLMMRSVAAAERRPVAVLVEEACEKYLASLRTE